MKILITSTQYPGYGGAATNAYLLIKYYRSIGINCAGLFYENKNVNVDPEKIGGIFRINSNLKDHLKIKNNIIKYIDGYPTHVFSKNYVAPVLSRNLFSKAVNIYLVSGCPHMIDLSKKCISAMDYINSKEKVIFDAEVKAISTSDLVVPNSKISKMLLNYHYGNIDKIINPIDTSNMKKLLSHNIKWKDKKFDIAFISSNFNRSVKNIPLALTILKDKRFKNKNIILIGDNSKQYEADNIRSLGLLSHEDTVNVILNTKVVINTSLYDASPNVVREALCSNSNVLISHNCGWSELYPKQFVVEDYKNVHEWTRKLNFLLKKDIEFSINTDIEKDMVELLK